MFVIIFITILLSTAFLLFNLKLKFTYWHRKKLISFPSSIPFGSIDSIFKKDTDVVGVQFKKFYDYFKSHNQPHGGAYVLTTPVYVPVDPTILKQIFVKDFQNFHSKGIYQNIKDQPIHGNLFQINGDKWKSLRNKLSPTFTSGKLKMMFPTIRDCAIPLIDAMDNLANLKQSVDIKDLSTKFALNVIGSVAFGIDCGAFEDESEFRHFSKKMFEPTKARAIIRAFSIASPTLAQKFGCLTFEKDEEDFFTKIACDNAKYRDENDVVRNDFFQLMLELKRNSCEGSVYNLQDVVNQSFVFFLAGFETSSKTMSYSLMELANNQNLQDKARAEINAMIEKHEGLNYEAVGEMHYLQQIINETLRKYPPLTVINRESSSRYHVPGTKVFLDPKTKIYIPVFAIHRDPDNFPEPEKYDPERFSNENANKIKPYTFIPFGEGPRLCIGMRFGYMQNKIGLAELLLRYKFTLHESTKLPLEFKNGVLLLNHKGTILLNVEKVVA